MNQSHPERLFDAYSLDTMRLTKSEIHTSIFQAMEDIRNGMAYGAVKDPDQIKAMSKHSGVWFKEYWKGFTAWILALIPIFGSVAITKPMFGGGVALLIMSALCAGWIGLAVWLYKKNQGIVIEEELETLRPALDLDENQSLYYDCILAVLNSKLLNDSQKISWLTSLSQALENAMQLDRISKELLQASGGKRFEELNAEQNRIQTLVESSTDPIAKDAYMQSLQMVKERVSKAESLAVQAERTEAHLELTRHTFIRTRETLKGLTLQNQNSVQVDLEPLRVNLSKVESESSTILKAIEELNQA